MTILHPEQGSAADSSCKVDLSAAGDIILGNVRLTGEPNFCGVDRIVNSLSYKKMLLLS